MKKLLSVAVILLLNSICLGPSINANISKENEFIEITTEVCGLNGEKHTIKLTSEQAEEVEALFNSIKSRLDRVETREEAEVIFKETVIDLYRYGLLGELSVKQAQKMVIGSSSNSRFMRLFDKIYSRSHGALEVEENFNCLIAGCTNQTGIFPGLFPLWMLLFQNFEQLLKLLITFAQIRPFYLSPPGVFIFKFGTLIEIIEGTGWVHTIGINGVKSWNGTLIGRYEEANKWAVICFSGLNILLDFKGLAEQFWYHRHFYLGFARHVIIEELD